MFKNYFYYLKSRATHVPVGEDQIQHLHYTQHIVQYFNGKYGETFPMPEPVISGEYLIVKV